MLFKGFLIHFFEFFLVWALMLFRTGRRSSGLTALQYFKGVNGVGGGVTLNHSRTRARDDCWATIATKSAVSLFLRSHLTTSSGKAGLGGAEVRCGGPLGNQAVDASTRTCGCEHVQRSREKTATVTIFMRRAVLSGFSKEQRTGAQKCVWICVPTFDKG